MSELYGCIYVFRMFCECRKREMKIESTGEGVLSKKRGNVCNRFNGYRMTNRRPKEEQKKRIPIEGEITEKEKKTTCGC